MYCIVYKCFKFAKQDELILWSSVLKTILKHLLFANEKHLDSFALKMLYLLF